LDRCGHTVTNLFDCRDGRYQPGRPLVREQTKNEHDQAARRGEDLSSCINVGSTVRLVPLQSSVSSAHCLGLAVAVEPNPGVDGVELRQWNTCAPAAKR
jgi:hypothetical protein